MMKPLEVATDAAMDQAIVAIRDLLEDRKINVSDPNLHHAVEILKTMMKDAQTRDSLESVPAMLLSVIVWMKAVLGASDEAA